MKKETKVEEDVVEDKIEGSFFDTATTVSKKIEHVSEDFSTEDMVSLARKVNEIVDYLNA